jgi:hypothetical protein
MWIFGQVWFACLVGFVVGAGLSWLLLARPAHRRALDLEQRLARHDQAATPAATSGLSFDDGSPASVPSLDHAGSVDPGSTYQVIQAVKAAHARHEPVAAEPGRNEVTDLFAPVTSFEPDDTAFEPDTSFEPATSFKSVIPFEPPSPFEPAESQRVEPKPAEPLTMVTPIISSFMSLTSEPVQSGESGQSSEPDQSAESGQSSERAPEPAEPDASLITLDRATGSDELFLEYLRAEVSGDGPVNAQPAEPELEPAAQPRTEPEPAAADEGAAAERGALVLGDYSADEDQHPVDTSAVIDQTSAADESHEHDGVELVHDDLDDVFDPHQDLEPEPVDAGFHAAEVTAVIPVITDIEPARHEAPAADEPTFAEPFADDQSFVAGHPVDEPANESFVDGSLLDRLLVDEPVPDQPMTGALSGELSSAAPAETAAELTGPVSADLIRALDEARRKLDVAAVPAPSHSEDDGDDWFATRSGTDIGAELGTDHLGTDLGAEVEADEPMPQPQVDTFAAEDPEPVGTIMAATAFTGPITEELPSRSLFEPVIEPTESSRDYVPGQAHPLRVRTGFSDSEQTEIRSPLPPVPARAPAGAPGWQVGPFGPGSALPLPDGSAPSPQFRVKARTSSMVFHTESSPFFDRLEPQVWFRGPEDAQRAGFTSWERPRTA